MIIQAPKCGYTCRKPEGKITFMDSCSEFWFRSTISITAVIAFIPYLIYSKKKKLKCLSSTAIRYDWRSWSLVINTSIFQILNFIFCLLLVTLIINGKRLLHRFQKTSTGFISVSWNDAHSLHWKLSSTLT